MFSSWVNLLGVCQAFWMCRPLFSINLGCFQQLFLWIFFLTLSLSSCTPTSFKFSVIELFHSSISIWFFFIISLFNWNSLSDATLSSYIPYLILFSFSSVNIFIMATSKSYSLWSNIWLLSQAVSVACFSSPSVWVIQSCFFVCLIIFLETGHLRLIHYNSFRYWSSPPLGLVVCFFSDWLNYFNDIYLSPAV